MVAPFATRERRALVSSFREFNKLVLGFVPKLAKTAVSARRRYHLRNIVPRIAYRLGPIRTYQLVPCPTRHHYPTRPDLPDH